MWPDKRTVHTSLQSLALLLFTATLFHDAESCSRRSTPKPRPPEATVRPNITAHTQECKEPYNSNFCLNGGSCFSIQIGNSPISINCVCPTGWTGRRCELKDLPDDYYIRSAQSRVEVAGLAGGVVFIILVVVCLSVGVVIYVRRKKKLKQGMQANSATDSTDAVGSSSSRQPFSVHNTRQPQHPHPASSSAAAVKPYDNYAADISGATGNSHMGAPAARERHRDTPDHHHHHHHHPHTRNNNRLPDPDPERESTL